MSALYCFEEKEKQGRYSLVSNVDIRVLRVTARVQIFLAEPNLSIPVTGNALSVHQFEYCGCVLSVHFGVDFADG